jgi:hypothetical protein
MGNLYNIDERNEMVRRIRSLTSGSKAKWGSMTVSQMVCHVADPIRALLGIRETPSAIPFFLKPLVKWWLLNKPRKHNAVTLKLFRQGSGGRGTMPNDFESDRSVLLDLIDIFCSKDEAFPFRHPAAGTVTREEAGAIVWGDLDHHLSQFGV